MKQYTAIPYTSVTLRDGFWQRRCKLNRAVSVGAVRDRFEETGRFDALRFRYKEGKPLHVFYDSDDAKWMEAVCYLYKKNPRGMAKNMRLVEGLIDAMEKNQREDGYLNSYFQQKEPENVFRDRNRHELYCAGHLVEAAIAYTEATGNGRFLAVMEKYMACIKRVFIDEGSAAFVTPGHPELELALMRLYRFTGKSVYLDMAKFFLLQRGNADEPEVYANVTKYGCQNIPILETEEILGHSVRALYLYAGAAAYALESGDEAMLKKCEELYADAERKAYITGGYGATRLSEAFVGHDDLPNITAYSESCASIAMLYFVSELLKAKPDSRYADTAERVMYNCLLSSTSAEGDAFFYENPLELHLRTSRREVNVPNPPPTALSRRQKVFECSCCPPNINRIFASFANLFFTKDEKTLYIHQFVSCDMREDFGTLSMRTRFPAQKTVELKLRDFRLPAVAIRLPAYAKGVSVKKNGENTSYRMENGYMLIDAEESMTLQVRFDFAPTFIESNPRVRDNCGRVALTYGPVAFCLEALDNGEELNALTVDTRRRVRILPDPETGLFTAEAQGFRDTDFEGTYHAVGGSSPAPVTLRYIPYYRFANRAECDMLVWVRRK